jgi:hypothetical protein
MLVSGIGSYVWETLTKLSMHASLMGTLEDLKPRAYSSNEIVPGIKKRRDSGTYLSYNYNRKLGWSLSGRRKWQKKFWTRVKDG